MNRSLPIKLSPWLVVMAVCVIYVFIICAANDFDPHVFVTIGTRFLDGDPNGTEGYDGQFAYYIATAPGSAADIIDVPAYRYQRILLPMLGRALALGSAALVPWAFVLINLAALAVGTFVMDKLLIAEGVNRWYALVYGLFPGLLMAVRLSLNEPLAYGLVVAGIWLERKNRLYWAAIALALAVLTKETTALFVAGYVLWMAVEGRWRDAFLFGFIASVPFGLWQIVLYQHFGAFGIGSGGALATPFEIIPFNGVWRIFTDTGSLKIFLIYFIILFPAVMLPAIWGLVRGTRDVARRAWHPYTFLLLANAGIMLFVPFSTYREMLGILRFIDGLVICVLLYAAHNHDRRVLRYSTLWLVLLAVVMNSG